MANMSYCRFHNTLTDLRDCMQFAEDFDTVDGLLRALGDGEAQAAKKLLSLCREFADAYPVEE